MIITSQSSGGCAENLAVAVTNSDGHGFGTTSKFPDGAPLTASNTVTLSAALPGGAGYQDWCSGVVEGNSLTGYMASLCNTGQWYIKAIVGLGSNGVIVGNQLATGSFPFTANDSYNISLAVKPGVATMTITLTDGSGSPLQQSVTTSKFTPTAVGYEFWNENPTIPINPAYTRQPPIQV